MSEEDEHLHPENKYFVLFYKEFPYKIKGFVYFY